MNTTRKRQIRMWAARALLWQARHQPTTYLSWLVFRWSLLAHPDVTPDERRDALDYWDMQGWLWGFCGYPKRQESERTR